jgi:cell wall assembly regulator SMI1
MLDASSTGSRHDNSGFALSARWPASSASELSAAYATHHAMRHVWRQIDAWLETYSPEVHASLSAPGDEAHIDEIQQKMGLVFPADLRASWLCHDGASGPGGFVDGWGLFSVDETFAEWCTYESDRADPALFASLSDHVRASAGVRSMYWNARWVPVAGLGSSDVVCVDLDPAPGGISGQVIVRWKSGDIETIASSFEHWLLRFATDLAAGRYVVEADGGLEKL